MKEPEVPEEEILKSEFEQTGRKLNEGEKRRKEKWREKKINSDILKKINEKKNDCCLD